MPLSSLAGGQEWTGGDLWALPWGRPWTRRGEKSGGPEGSAPAAVYTGRPPGGRARPRSGRLALETVRITLSTTEEAGGENPRPLDQGEGQPGVLTRWAQWQHPGEGPWVSASLSRSRAGAAALPCDSRLGKPPPPRGHAPQSMTQRGRAASCGHHRGTCEQDQGQVSLDFSHPQTTDRPSRGRRKSSLLTRPHPPWCKSAGIGEGTEPSSPPLGPTDSGESSRAS